MALPSWCFPNANLVPLLRSTNPSGRWTQSVERCNYTVLSRSHKWRYCLFFTKKWINFLWPELEGFARDQWSPCDCGGGCRYSQYFCRVFWDSAAQQVVLAMLTHPLLLAPSILFPIYREPMHYIFQKTFLSTPLALFFQGERHSVISFILQ